MALIKCGECGRSVSNQAASCPGRGAPINGASVGARLRLSQQQVKITVQKGMVMKSFFVFFVLVACCLMSMTVNADDRVFTVISPLNIHDFPDATSPVLGELKVGQEVHVLGTMGAWFRIGEYKRTAHGRRAEWVESSGVSESVPSASVAELGTLQLAHPTPVAQKKQVVITDYLHASVKQLAWIERGEDLVRQMMKDPDSAKFQNVFFAQSEIPVTCGEVNSKNSFGAYIGYQRFLSAGRAELTFVESQVDDFGSVWRQFCQ